MTAEQIKKEIKIIQFHPVLDKKTKDNLIEELNIKKQKLAMVEESELNPSELRGMFN